MSKSKVHMPKDLEKKCHIAIHTATVAAAAAGAIPIPMADAVPITAVQIGMIVRLGNVFGVSLSDSAAKSILGVGATKSAGRALAANLIKAVPAAGKVIGGIISAGTAATLTEALGWIVTDDFYRVSIGEAPQNIVEATNTLKELFEGLRMHKYRFARNFLLKLQKGCRLLSPQVKRKEQIKRRNICTLPAPFLQVS